MDEPMEKGCPVSLNEWVKFFIEFIVPDDLSEDVAGSFLMHLADLGVLLELAESTWQWRGCDSPAASESLITVVQKDLELLCDSDSGFALAYFIGYKKLNKKPLVAEVEDKVRRRQSASLSATRPASDLSNLQIVKKTGKQLQPFLQIEESVVSRLTGKYAGKQDAQKLFHYMLMGDKAEPKVWEQLSRKRHR